MYEGRLDGRFCCECKLDPIGALVRVDIVSGISLETGAYGRGALVLISVAMGLPLRGNHTAPLGWTLQMLNRCEAIQVGAKRAR